jgi:DNA-binding GntR family transcriptional regulator
MPDKNERATGAASFEDIVARLADGYRSIGEMVYEVIRQAIISGAFAPGERLRQESLAAAIGVSRLPVRSALVQLESEGLVTFHPRRGAVVRSLTLAQIREIYETRELLESHALAKSMATMTPQRLKELRQLASAMDAEHEGGGFVDTRVAFYRALYDAENNPQLVEIIETLRSSVGRYLLGWRLSTGHPGGHKQLVEFMRRGDLAAAQDWLKAHLEQVRRGVEEIVQDATSPSGHPQRADAEGQASADA